MSPKKEMKFPGYISLRLEEDLRKKLKEIAESSSPVKDSLRAVPYTSELHVES